MTRGPSTTTTTTIGVLGGSGLYEIDGLTDLRSVEVSTPYGSPSGPLVSGRVGKSRLLFIPRHGPGHRFSPSEINYRANVFALKAAGATRVLSVSAVGSLKDGLSPGDYVLVDQFIDKTFRRASTFFGEGRSARRTPRARPRTRRRTSTRGGRSWR